jgi:hypothetical protein
MHHGSLVTLRFTAKTGLQSNLSHTKNYRFLTQTYRYKLAKLVKPINFFAGELFSKTFWFEEPNIKKAIFTAK